MTLIIIKIKKKLSDNLVIDLTPPTRMRNSLTDFNHANMKNRNFCVPRTVSARRVLETLKIGTSRKIGTPSSTTGVRHNVHPWILKFN